MHWGVYTFTRLDSSPELDLMPWITILIQLWPCITFASNENKSFYTCHIPYVILSFWDAVRYRLWPQRTFHFYRKEEIIWMFNSAIPYFTSSTFYARALNCSQFVSRLTCGELWWTQAALRKNNSFLLFKPYTKYNMHSWVISWAIFSLL